MKKFLSLVFALLILTTCVCIPAFATEVEPYAVTRHCTECAAGTVTMYESRRYEHDETFPCDHYARGEDVYAVYEVTIRESCDSCSYSSEYSYEDHVLRYCRGHN